MNYPIFIVQFIFLILSEITLAPKLDAETFFKLLPIEPTAVLQADVINISLFFISQLVVSNEYSVGEQDTSDCD